MNDIKVEYDYFRDLAYKTGSAIAKITNKSDVILISKRTSIEQLASFIGCILYGRIPVIIPHPSKKVFKNEFLDKMNKIDQVAKPVLCISDTEDLETYSQIWKTVDNIDVDVNILPQEKLDPEETAFIQLSSGTTALPKVIRITHQALIAQCDEYCNFIGLKPGDVVVSWLPLYHDMGLIACFLLPILMKISFVHINPFEWLSNPNMLFEQIEKYKGTHVWLPNFAFSYMAKRCTNSKCNISSMKQWISCSEVTHTKDVMNFVGQFRRIGARRKQMYVCYALAENIFAVSQGPLNAVNNIISCGTIIPGTSVLIKNGQNIIVDNKEGDIYIRSSCMASGLSVDTSGYYFTGDRGFISDNNLFVLGRSDDMIISYGKNIYPYDIENIVSSMNGIIPGRVACFGTKNSLGTEDVFVVAEGEADENAIREAILSNFDIGAKCKVVPRGYIIKTSSGKISRKRTREKVLSGN